MFCIIRNKYNISFNMQKVSKTNDTIFHILTHTHTHTNPKYVSDKNLLNYIGFIYIVLCFKTINLVDIDINIFQGQCWQQI